VHIATDLHHETGRSAAAFEHYYYVASGYLSLCGMVPCGIFVAFFTYVDTNPA
jgi:hypothetical protein